MIVATAQLSTADGRPSDTLPTEFEPGGAATVKSLGHVMRGGSMSLTVTVKEQVLAFPPASVTRKVFVVTPLGKIEPLASPLSKVSVAPGQLSPKAMA